MATTEWRIDVKGLRDLNGRFASFKDTKLAEIQLEEARSLGRTARDVYRTYAPRSALGSTSSGMHFRDSFGSSASLTGSGFRVEVKTSQPTLAMWLREGTGIYGPLHHLIFPRTAKALGPVFNWFPKGGGGGSGPFWFRFIRGMKPNPWELEAEAEIGPLADETASRIGVKAADYLGDVKT